VLLNEHVIRVFVAFLDQEKIGRIGFVDVDAARPTKVLDVSEEPVLDIGRPGTFDDNGVSPIAVVRVDDELLLYYVGWQLGVRVRYFLFAGLAIGDSSGGAFRRHSQTPLLERSNGELFVRTAPFVMRDEDRWKMWYIAGDSWISRADTADVPAYAMRYMESSSPKEWPRHGRICLEPTGPDEFGFGRPFVIKENGLFKCWYSIRTFSKGYRVGYAESSDGVSWTRHDAKAGIDVSNSGWDSEMLCFPCVQTTKYGTYMFYNGNNYGETGFGAAVLERSDPQP
jgi:predicted GH43/DUF377 family glycosyl hydrolase